MSQAGDFTWYIPSFYGDVRLERNGRGAKKGKETRVSWENLTQTEGNALMLFFRHAVDKGWATSTDIPEGLLPASRKGGPFRAIEGSHGSLNLAVDIGKAQKVLAKQLRPGKELLDFVKFADGRIETGHVVDFEKVEEPAKHPTAGATVAKPELGCPEPRLGRAELRAREALFAFLDEQQQSDFAAHNRFVTVGASGARYMVTSRHNQRALAAYGGRQLFDLDIKHPFCIHHDKMVPAAEEMLTLHLMVKVPEHERYVRGLW